MMIRYMILSPSDEARQTFLGRLFGSFELAPRGGGEKKTLNVSGGDLEVVGAGRPGKLFEIVRKLLAGGVRLDGILVLIPSGDEGSWKESRRINNWLQENQVPLSMKSWVFGDLSDLDKETARKALLTLLSEHERVLAE